MRAFFIDVYKYFLNPKTFKYNQLTRRRSELHNSTERKERAQELDPLPSRKQRKKCSCSDQFHAPTTSHAPTQEVARKQPPRAPLAPAAGMTVVQQQQQRSSLAEEARLLFKGGRFTEAAAAVREVHEGLGVDSDDPKVLHNLAVVDFHRGGCKDPRRLLEALLRVQALAEAQIHRVDGNDGAAAAGGGDEGSTGGGAGGGFSEKDAVTTTARDDHGYETFVLRLNVAFALQELAHFARSVAILEPLFDAVEAVDEPVALRVCALLTRVRRKYGINKGGWDGRNSHFFKGEMTLENGGWIG